MITYPIVPVPPQSKKFLRRCYARSSRRLPVQLRIWVCRKWYLRRFFM